MHEASATIYFEHAGSRPTGGEIVAAFIGRGTLDYTWSGDIRLGDRSATCGGGRKGVPASAMLQLREHADGRREYQIAGQAEIEGSLGTGCDGSPVEGAEIPFVFTGWRPLDSLDEIGDRERIDFDEANHLERSWTLTVDTGGGDL